MIEIQAAADNSPSLDGVRLGLESSAEKSAFASTSKDIVPRWLNLCKLKRVQSRELSCCYRLHLHRLHNCSQSGRFRPGRDLLNAGIGFTFLYAASKNAARLGVFKERTASEAAAHISPTPSFSLTQEFARMLQHHSLSCVARASYPPGRRPLTPRRVRLPVHANQPVHHQTRNIMSSYSNCAHGGFAVCVGSVVVILYLSLSSHHPQTANGKYHIHLPTRKHNDTVKYHPLPGELIVVYVQPDAHLSVSVCSGLCLISNFD